MALEARSRSGDISLSGTALPQLTCSTRAATKRFLRPAAQYQEFAFAPNVELTAGAQYVAFLSISDLPAQVSGTYTMPHSSLTDALPGGGFVFQNNGQSFGQLFGTVWSSFGSNDVAFKASFGAVPEPATWALMILGFGVVGGAMRRRQSATAKVRFA